MPTSGPEPLDGEPLSLDNEPLACPRCRRIDQVRKVSAIVSHGTTTGATVSDLNHVFGHHLQTGLAMKLSPPAEPKYHLLWFWFWFCVVASCISLAAAFPVYSGTASRLIGTALFAVAAAIIWRLWAIADAKYLIAQKKWRKQTATWKQSFFCLRCDELFIP